MFYANLIIEIIFLVIIFVFCAILPIIALIIYKYFSNKNKIFRKISFTILSIITLIMAIVFLAISIQIISSMNLSEDPFATKYEKIIINQKIGGKLICLSEYEGNLQDWEYRVKYYYIPQKDDTIPIGSGYFDTRSWGRDEQLGKYGDWLFLRTANDKYMDKVILKNIVTDSTTSYQINVSDRYSFERLKQEIDKYK